MYILKGIKYNSIYNGDTEVIKERIALFTTKEKAKQYINKRRLKHEIETKYYCGRKIFKVGSGLEEYEHYSIEPEPKLEIDPE